MIISTTYFFATDQETDFIKEVKTTLYLHCISVVSLHNSIKKMAAATTTLVLISEMLIDFTVHIWHEGPSVCHLSYKSTCFPSSQVSLTCPWEKKSVTLSIWLKKYKTKRTSKDFKALEIQNSKQWCIHFMPCVQRSILTASNRATKGASEY